MQSMGQARPLGVGVGVGTFPRRPLVCSGRPDVGSQGDRESVFSLMACPEGEPKPVAEALSIPRCSMTVPHFADPAEMQIGRACFASAIAFPPALQEADQ